MASENVVEPIIEKEAGPDQKVVADPGVSGLAKGQQVPQPIKIITKKVPFRPKEGVIPNI